MRHSSRVIQAYHDYATGVAYTLSELNRHMNDHFSCVLDLWPPPGSDLYLFSIPFHFLCPALLAANSGVARTIIICLFYCMLIVRMQA